MINIYVNDSKFDYDIQNLMKSFFPEEDIKMVGDEALKDAEYSVLFGNGQIVFRKNDGAFEKCDSLSQNIERSDEKNVLKRLIYKAISEYTGKSLAWGDLSGIRPTKIAMKRMELGEDDESIIKFMQDNYLVGDEKSRLCVDIARRERNILSPLHYKGGYSLYIGIPFCPTTCMYCSFTSYSIAKYANIVENYLKALFKEIDYVAADFKDKILDTIYIGGGTPTTLSADQLERLLSYIHERLNTSGVIEFTVEAGRADSITIEKLKVLKANGVTRISVNPQTMNQKTLDIIGRRHRVEDVKRAFYEARSAGHDNINMDIILGLPEEGLEEVRHTISGIKELNPESLTVHSLAIKRASRMHEWIEQKGYKTMINTNETMDIAYRGAMDLGMEPYYLYRQKNMAGSFENTGYAKPGKFGIYNILIMEEVQTIVACGAGTVSKKVSYGDKVVGSPISRCDNVKDVELYIEKIDEMIERKKMLFSDEKE